MCTYIYKYTRMQIFAIIFVNIYRYIYSPIQTFRGKYIHTKHIYTYICKYICSFSKNICI